MTDNQIKLLSKGLKFIPNATITKNKKTAPTLARLQRFHTANALEIHFSRAKQINTSLLCQIKLGTVIPTISPTWKRLNKKPNLSRKKRKALHVLQQSKDLNFKKADKGNTLVVMDKNDKIQEGQVQINDLDNYKPLNKPIVKETHTKVSPARDLKSTSWQLP